ncbi:hybrid sensor histidine kinase/response regulator [Nitrincola sp.]|uniref:hybrid sensor histidine kinase/response regulator n=1 Tax=Nitrincola sp. TaxID=1926584 RepID=UPI003A8EFB34
MNPTLADQLTSLCDQLDQPTEQLAETLAELSEQCQEAEFSGMGDLLALISELVTAEEEGLTPEHQAALGMILGAPGKQMSLEDLLTASASILTADIWQAPLETDDIEALPELLEEDWPLLLAGSTTDAKTEVEATETPDTDIEPEMTDSVVETAIDAADMLDVTVFDQAEESWASDTPSQLPGPVTQALQQADGPETFSEQLADLSESLAEQDPPLISDLFALASEQIASLESLDIEILPTLASQLDQLLDTPDHPCTSTALELLGNDAWPEPLDPEDRAEQQALIDEAFLTDSASAELDLAQEPVQEPVLSLELEPEVEIDQEHDLASTLIADTDNETNETDAIAPTGPATSALAACAEPEALSELLAELSEALVEREPTLLSDLVALAAELCGSLESLDGDALPVLMIQLDRLLEEPSHETATQALAMLSDSSWPAPLEPEDQEGLQELIDAEFLAADTADDLEPVVAVTATEPDDLIGPAVNALHSAQTGAELSEQLLELSEAMADMAPTLISDLFALAGEGSEALDDLNPPIVAALCQQLDLLVQNPTAESATQALSLLSDSNWPTPLDPEDAEELQSLVSESFAQPLEGVETFIETDTEASAQPPLQAEPEPQVPEVALALPSFCEVEMSLLEQAGPKVDPQILAMLSATLLQLTQLWEQTEPNSNSALLAASQEALLPLERACGTVHLNGIRTVLEGLGRNLEYLEQRQQPLEVFEHTHFTHCLEALQAHLADLGDKGNRDQLVDAISDTGLPAHADPQQSAFITGLLALAGIQAPEDIEHPQATAEDIELSIADDIDPQLLEMLYDELPTLVDEFQQHLQAVLDEQQTDSLLSAQRAAHTIKGLANMAGIRGLAKLTHCMEDVLEVLTDAKTLPGPQLAEDLTEATDCLAQMSESISEAEPAPDGALEVLQSMMDWFYRLRTEGIEAAGQALSGKKKRTPKAAPAVAKDEQPSEQKQAAQGGGEQGQLRVPVSLLDNLFRIAGESSTLNAQLDDRLNQMHRLARANRERQRILQKVMFDIEQQLQDYFTLNPTEGSDDSHFDPLEMDRYHSMHTTLSQLQEAVADVREVGREMADHIRHLDEMHASQTNLQKESLDNVLNTRLVPVKTLSSRMQRIMRQACRAAGKEANLVIEGEGVLIDSQVLGQLADPLMHIIRNAVDHGLEAADVRAESGKDETGTLTISFRQAQNQVQVSCSDDGGGINVTRVKEIAERKGLLKGGRVLSDNEAQRLILIPGFSTRDEVSQLSGRGIGMDVVYQQVTRLQGTISIHSVQGEGTRFDLALPASSLLVHTLLVRSANKRIHALSSHTIEQSLLSADGELTTTDDGMTFTTDEGTYPAYTLETLLGEKPGDYTGKRLFPILLVKLDQGEKAAVLVPEVLAHREQVFKSMGEHLPDIPGVPGVTILADGSVAPIVDLQGRIRQRHSALSPVAELAEPEFNLHLPEVLVVDDSLSARKTLATLLSDSGYEVRTAIDGLDALDKIRQEPPAIVLTDLEMPRMSGMELAAILRNSRQYNNIPVVMITSRSTHKHRGEAEAAGVSAYLTKPWTETQVLDQVQKLLF